MTTSPGGAAPGAVAREFHRGTKHSWDSVRRRGHLLDWSNKPHPFKVYEEIEAVHPPRDFPMLGVAAFEAMAARPREERAPDLPALARLLFLAAGVSRTRRYDGEVFHFRTYASAGALYPVEVYPVVVDVPGLADGAYHFDPLGFGLVPLRPGDHRGSLVRASGGEEAVAAAPAVLVLTGVPWKTGWKYAERGYRHLFWDAGMILANLLAAAGSAGLAARVVMGFVDREVEALLGLDGVREFPLCLVPVGREGAARAGAAQDPPGAGRPALRTRPFSSREPIFEAVTRVNDAGRLDDDSAVRARRSSAPEDVAERGTAGDRFVVEPAPAPRDPLEEVILRRGSARSFTRGTMPASMLASILEVATAGVPFDHRPEGSRGIRPYFIANAVEGLSAGAYAFEDGGFVLLQEGRFRDQAGYLCLEQRLAADAAATIFLLTDLDRILEAMGDRGYRVAELEGGIVAGRIYLGAYAHRFGATGLTFYDDEVVDFFSPHAAGKECMLVVAVGESPRLRRGSAR